MEDTINTGDLIFCEVTDDPSYEYKKGDIVTFYKNINGNSELNTHRIVEVVKDDNITYYRTQGDNKKTNPEPDEELQTSSSIVAKYTGTKIGGVGNFLSFLRTQPGFFLCVLLPMIIFFVYEAILLSSYLFGLDKIADLIYSSGEIPTCLLNTLHKWLWSQKPTAAATSTTFIPLSSSSCAFLIRH